MNNIDSKTVFFVNLLSMYPQDTLQTLKGKEFHLLKLLYFDCIGN